MDARPQRPIRALRVQTDENCAPVVCNKKILHYQSKSSGNIAPLTVAGFKAGAKRTAFGDVSNTVKNLPNLPEDPAHEQNNILKCSELHENPAPFLKPPQRTHSTGLVKLTIPTGITSTSDIKQVASISKKNHVRPTLPVKRSLSKRSATVYKDLDTKNKSNSYPQAIRSDRIHSAVLNHDQPKINQKINQICSIQIGKNSSLPVEEKPAEKLPINFKPRNDRAEQALAVPNEENHGKEKSHTKEISRPDKISRHESKNHLTRQPSLPPFISEVEEYLEEEEEEECYEDQGHLTLLSYRSCGDNTTGGATTLLCPKITQEVLLEIESARRYTEKHRTIEDIGDEMWDTSMVAEYSDEIFAHMRELEILETLTREKTTNTHHTGKNATKCALYGSSNRDPVVNALGFDGLVNSGKLQLVGATAIFVAAKYEEIRCPSVQEIAYMVDGGYTIDEILKAERFMLNMLQFELGWPGPMSFLRRISKADEYDLETRTLAKYFLEITVMDERFVGSPPSYIAAGSHCLARLMLRKGEWSKNHVHYSGYTWTQLRPLVALIRECCRNPLKHHNAVYEKYSERRFKCAAQFVNAEIRRFIIPPVQPYKPSLPSNENVIADGLYENRDSLRRTNNRGFPLSLFSSLGLNISDSDLFKSFSAQY